MATSHDWSTTDYYDVLGVSVDASDIDIRRAYRRLARRLHPDTNGDAAAEQRFKEITAAHDVLGDPDRRRAYDEYRCATTARRDRARFGPDVGGTRIRVDNVDPDVVDLGDVADPGDLFGDLFPGFGRSRAPGRGRGHVRRDRTRPRRGADLSSTLSLPFLDAVHGATTAIDLVADVECDTCNGAGATAAGASCSICGRTGRVSRRRTVKVRIPGGVDDGQTIRLPQRGGPGRSGGPAGDLYVTVEVQPHPDFDRLGDDITVTVPVTYPELVLGTDIAVPTVDAGTVTVRVPPGTPAGRTLRIPGRGIPDTDGDLLVTLDVIVPTNPKSTERELLERLRTLSSARRPDPWESTT